MALPTSVHATLGRIMCICFVGAIKFPGASRSACYRSTSRCSLRASFRWQTKKPYGSLPAHPFLLGLSSTPPRALVRTSPTP
ncbi:hypothetical protein EXIGLDRAFT_737412 [Exidia glandulosa HHB12029]|uniref:Uncharacterized protein n=1 Tax=Exidia glandulosa HHB12029 TaxID=1314781 RepID=A0A165IZR4_EXIGL|nr:hypothetical protein EXIGLDRAFT_737412 [Exidia glandulosa HHB12029]